MCPDGKTHCAGDQCCPNTGSGRSTCPSASKEFVDGCDKGKVTDCTMKNTCVVDEYVLCPDGKTHCQGDQCCPDTGSGRSTCPSASKEFVDGCDTHKVTDCTKRKAVF